MIDYTVCLNQIPEKVHWKLIRAYNPELYRKLKELLMEEFV